MKITLTVTDIDYGTLAEQLLPAVRDKLAEKDGTGIAILAKLAEIPPALAGKMIGMLPQETKDEIAVKLISMNKHRIRESAMEYAEKKGFPCRITELDVE